MYYHASPLAGLEVLEPRVAYHGTPLVYFSTKRENILIYLSNAVEKYCRETGFAGPMTWHKWATYGFDSAGLQRIDEYYPDALAETYGGVSGYIYHTDALTPAAIDVRIPDVAASAVPVRVTGVEYVPDAYLAILEAERAGLLRVERYAAQSEKKRAYIAQTVRQNYAAAKDSPDYRHFLRGHFAALLEDVADD